MTLSIPDYSLPMMYENDDEDYKYSIGGTCFIISLSGFLFVLAARHTLSNLGYEPEQVLIPYFIGCRDFLPIDRFIEIKNSKGEPFKDILLLKVNMNLLSEVNRSQAEIYELKLIDSETLNISLGSKLHVQGFPDCISNIDYDEYQIIQQRYITEAFYDGDGLDEWTYKVSFHNLDDIECLNGMSGGPIFQPDLTNHRFIGVLLRGTKQSMIGYFVESKVVYAMVYKAIYDPD